jgi:hypothetical protein
MIKDVIEDIKFRDLIKNQIRDIIDYLLVHNKEFAITANIKGVSFNPEIPKSVVKNFSSFTIFTLSNYTYSTIVISDENISFEAGFGADNFGSRVTITFYALFQLLIDDSILFVNPTATVEKYFLEENINKQNQASRSKNAFSMNPKNKNLLS